MEDLVNGFKITKRGLDPDREDRMWQSTCYKCKSEFEFPRSKTKLIHVEPSSDPREHDWMAVTCPVCGNQCSAQEIKERP